jgi:DNA-directed RNA polymerase specialized sigma24 family protein
MPTFSSLIGMHCTLPSRAFRKPKQEAHLLELHAAGQHTTAELAELFGVARSTIYRAVQRAQQSGATR